MWKPEVREIKFGNLYYPRACLALHVNVMQDKCSTTKKINTFYENQLEKFNAWKLATLAFILFAPALSYDVGFLSVYPPRNWVYAMKTIYNIYSQENIV